MKILYNRKQTSEKKSLINRISELTGVKPKYLGAPNMIYQIGSYQVDRDGNLIAPDDQDAIDLVSALKLYGYEETTLGGVDLQEAEMSEDSIVETTEETPTEESISEDVIAETTEETPTEAIEEIATVEESIEEVTACEPTDVNLQTIGTEAEPVRLSIAFPLSQHTSQSIRNLVNLIYSRGSLVSKAVQGEFFAPQEIVDAPEEKRMLTALDEVNRIKKLEVELGVEIKGIRFEEGKVIFTGFPETSDADILLAFQHLAEKMNKQAIEQKRIHPKAVNDENEKYSMRTWLVRIGMEGNQYKKTRNILMQYLKGHTAFRTPADAERWKAKQDALKAERKAAQEAEQCLE